MVTVRRWAWTAVVAAVAIGPGCESEPKISPQAAAVAEQTLQQMDQPSSAVTSSRYRTYRWLTTEEMVQARLGYDPTLSESTRSTVEDAVDDDLAQQGYQEGAPADFLVAFNDVYVDRNRMDPGGPFDGPAVEVSESPTGGGVWGYSGLELYRYPEETFTILFLDAQTHKLIWRGIGVDKLTGFEQSPEHITAAVFHALDTMPQPLGQ